MCLCIRYMYINRKMDGLGVSGMSIVSGIDTKFGYLALIDPQFFQKTSHGLLKGMICRI